jgi:hypothetical protein
MHWHLVLVPFLALIAAAFGAPPAVAQEGPHFTFVVDVELRNMREDVAHYTVTCGVCDQSCEGLPAASFLARETARVEVNGAADVTQQVTIPVTLPPEVSPNAATHYICRCANMQSLPPNRAVVPSFDVPVTTFLTVPDGFGFGRAKAGTDLVNVLAGELPQ